MNHQIQRKTREPNTFQFSLFSGVAVVSTCALLFSIITTDGIGLLVLYGGIILSPLFVLIGYLAVKLSERLFSHQEDPLESEKRNPLAIKQMEIDSARGSRIYNERVTR